MVNNPKKLSFCVDGWVKRVSPQSYTEFHGVFIAMPQEK